MFHFNNNAVIQGVRGFDLADHFFRLSLRSPITPARNRVRHRQSSPRRRHSRQRRRRRPQHNRETLYFAFGSNLWLTQMAERCPDSRYMGRAILRNYRWQINQRGVANVVPCPNPNPNPHARVEGLCYALSANDQARLDRSEGVPAAYLKSSVDVTLFPADATLAGRRTAEIVERDLARTVAAQRAARRQVGGGFMCFPWSYGVPRDGRVVGQEVRALIYVSAHHTRDSAPRREYRERMHKGIRDARRLGVSSTYVSNVLRPALDRR